VTIGQTLRPLGWAGLLAPRSPLDVPSGIPINRTAADTGIAASAMSSGYRLIVGGSSGRSFRYACEGHGYL